MDPPASARTATPRSGGRVIRQLVARGLLQVDVDGYGALRLTGAARPALRGEVPITLRRDAPAPRTRRDRRTSAAAADRPRSVADPAHQALFDALRQRRRELATSQGVPPYVIFHDASLVAMADRRPRSLDEFAAIPGVGATKLERYGQTFLDVIRAHAQDSDDSTPAASPPLAAARGE